MVKCSFCGKEEPIHKGVHFIKNDGSINFLCSEKCRKNAYKLKRDKKRLKWTEAYVLRKEKEIVDAKRMVEKQALMRLENQKKDEIAAEKKASRKDL